MAQATKAPRVVKTKYYRAYIEWVALNDEPTLNDPEQVEQQILCAFIADQYNTTALDVATDVVAYRVAQGMVKPVPKPEEAPKAADKPKPAPKPAPKKKATRPRRAKAEGATVPVAA